MMEAPLQRRVQRYGWDKAAPHYEAHWKQQLGPAQRRMLELAQIQPGERVLDVACGTGLTVWPVMEKVGSAGEVVATDLSGEMVDAAQAEAEARGATNVRFERMDAETLEFSGECFDAVLCGLGLMYFPDPGRSLREMRRVVCDDGRASVAVWGQRERCGWAEVFSIVDRRVNTAVCPLFFQLGTGDALRWAMESACFVDVEVDRIATKLEYASVDEALTAVFAAGPVALAYSRMDDATKHKAHAEYVASIEPYKAGDGYEIPGEFVVACGHRF